MKRHALDFGEGGEGGGGGGGGEGGLHIFVLD